MFVRVFHWTDLSVLLNSCWWIKEWVWRDTSWMGEKCCSTSMRWVHCHRVGFVWVFIFHGHLLCGCISKCLFGVCHPLADPQPVYDVCGLPSCQGIHCGQDSTCSGQDLWLLWTRCAFDEYFKYYSLKIYRAWKLSYSPWFMNFPPFLVEFLSGFIVVLCVCSIAFEATRFYNVSESSPLARQLCDGPTCNEVESSANQWIGEMRRCPLTVHWCTNIPSVS